METMVQREEVSDHMGEESNGNVAKMGGGGDGNTEKSVRDRETEREKEREGEK